MGNSLNIAAQFRKIARSIGVAKRKARHYRKIALKRIDISWDFFQFERSVHPGTWDRHGEILLWAQQCAQNSEKLENSDCYESSEDPIGRQGYTLLQQVKKKYKGRRNHMTDMRILVHVPSWDVSPGGYSAANNMIQSLDFIGLAVQALHWNKPIEPLLKSFRPTVFITSDHDSYRKRINWESLAAYRKSNLLSVGLTASLEEYGNTPLMSRLDWAEKNHVDFYYSFRSPEYLQQRKEYRPFYEKGYRIYSIEFGANPLTYYPVPGFRRDINYAFLASSNPDKWKRYASYLASIFRLYPGYIDGPGWSMIGNFTFNPVRDRYVYSRAKVGINLHIDNQIDHASELNERTYMLAACGVPQLIDNPKLLSSRFSSGCFYSASSPEEYETLFQEIIHNQETAIMKALQAQWEVFEKHTTFHRAERFALELAHDRSDQN